MFFLGLQKKCFLSLLEGVFQKEFTNLQFLRRLLHLYIKVNLTFVKTSCTFSRLYSLFMMFNIRAKVCEFVITKDSCIFGVNRMQCVRKCKIRILDNACYKRMLPIEFPGRFYYWILTTIDNF